MLVDRLVVGAIVSEGVGGREIGRVSFTGSLTGCACCFEVRVVIIDLRSVISAFSAFSSCVVL